MNDPFFAAACAGPRDNDANMTASLLCSTIGKAPGDDVSYFVVVEGVGLVEDFPKTREIALEVGNAAVVDIAIRALALP